MSLRIYINEREYTNPVVKYALALAVLLGAIAISALVVFVLLPAIGITIALAMGLMIVIAVGIFAATVSLVLGSAILAVLMKVSEKLFASSNRY